MPSTATNKTITGLTNGTASAIVGVWAYRAFVAWIVAG